MFEINYQERIRKMNRKIDAQMISVMGMLVALIVVLSNILAIDTQFLKITLEFIPKMIMGMMFGPYWAAVGTVLADIIGNTLFAKAPFFIGFTLNKLIEGLIYGHFFYKKEVTWKNSFACTLLVTLIISLILTPIWLAIMYSVPINSWVIWGPRIVKAVISVPLQTFVMYTIGNTAALKRITNKFGFVA